MHASLAICGRYKHFSLATIQSAHGHSDMWLENTAKYKTVVMWKRLSISELINSQMLNAQKSWQSMMIFTSCSLTEVTERYGCEPRALRYVCQQCWPVGEPLDTPCDGGRKGKGREREMEKSGCVLLSDSARARVCWVTNQMPIDRALWLRILCTGGLCLTHAPTRATQQHVGNPRHGATSMGDCALH